MTMQLLVRVLKDGYGYHDDHKKDDLIYMNLNHMNEEIKKGHVEIVCNNIGNNVEHDEADVDEILSGILGQDIKPTLVNSDNDIRASLKEFIEHNKESFIKADGFLFLSTYSHHNLFDTLLESFEEYINCDDVHEVFRFTLAVRENECKLHAVSQNDSGTPTSHTLFDGIL